MRYAPTITETMIEFIKQLTKKTTDRTFCQAT